MTWEMQPPRSKGSPAAEADAPTLAQKCHGTGTLLTPTTPKQRRMAASYVAAHAPADLVADWLDALGLTEVAS